MGSGASRAQARIGRLFALLALVALASPAGAGAAPPPPQQSPVFAFGTAAPNALSTPTDAAVDADGNVWVVDRSLARVFKYDYNGNFIASFAGTSAGPFQSITGIATDNSDAVYVPETVAGKVIEMTTGGDFVRTFGSPGDTGPGELNSPTGAAVDAAGVVYVADEGNGRVVRFAADGTPLKPIGTGRLSGPFSLAIFKNRLLVGDRGLGYVVEFTNRGKFLRNIGAPGTLGNFTTNMNPTGAPGEVEVEPTGLVDAVDIRADLVRRFTLTGQYVDSVGTPGNNPLQLSQPLGLGVDCRGSLYVTDEGTSQVVKFGYAGAPPPPCTPPAPPKGIVDGQLNDIDVTQAVQPVMTFTASDAPGGRTRAYAAGSTGEVSLQAGRKTVARVYASLKTGPAGGIGNVPATLEGMVGGQSLGTIQPDASPSVLRVGDTTVGPGQRTDPAGAYTFTLPDAWTRQNALTLVAHLNPAGIGCSAICQLRSTFRLTGVHFNTLPDTETLRPVALTIDGTFPALSGGPSLTDSPQAAFSAALTVIPRNLVVGGWTGQIDVGELNRATELTVDSCLLGIDLGILCKTHHYYPSDSEFRGLLEGQIFDALQQLSVFAPPGQLTIGVIANARGELAGSTPSSSHFNQGFGGTMYVTADRPLTSVSHEINHALGRVHASYCNGGGAGTQRAETWPPDERGYLEGVGLDTRAGSGGGRGPYKIIAAGAPGDPAQEYDFMSYCANIKGDPDSWISPKGWTEVINYHNSGATPTAALRVNGALSAEGTPPLALHVPRAFAAGGSQSILSASGVQLPSGQLALIGSHPAIGRPSTGNPASPYRLEARDTAGRILASAVVDLVPNAGGGGESLISGSVARPAGTAELVLRNGTTTATRLVRSAHTPKIRLLGPLRGPVSGSAVPVRWLASDADHDPLTATVEYSADGGRRFSRVWVGPSTVRPRIRISTLVPSSNARLRVTVDDGFNEAQATSRRLIVRGAPPQVLITAPRAGGHLPAGAPLYLSGTATGDAGRPLKPAALRWFDGDHPLGRGTSLSVPGLLAGRHRLRLVAQEGGRSAQAGVSVTIRAYRPEFLLLSAPATVRASARRVTLRVAATEPARLRVGGQQFTVSPTPQRIPVRISRGRGILTLRLVLTAGGQRTTAALAVTRD